MTVIRAPRLLAQKLGYEFQNDAYLRLALTHRSKGMPNNERLEFLGDGVLNFTVADLLYGHFPKLAEGDLSRLRAHLVREQTLSEIAAALEIGDFLLLGEGELKSGGFRRPSILADTLEALLGAIYLDGGFGAAQGVIRSLFEARLSSLDPKTVGKDAKTLLQEHLQALKLPLPEYAVLAVRGEAHEQHFDVACRVAALDIRTEGGGHSRRAAEQQAAQLAYDQVLARGR